MYILYLIVNNELSQNNSSLSYCRVFNFIRKEKYIGRQYFATFEYSIYH